MWNSASKLVVAIGFCLAIAFSWGCMGTPAYRMWYRSQWMEDEQAKPSLHARLEELDALRSRASGMIAAEQAQIAANLSRSLADDPTPLYRANAVRTLAELSTPAATEALRAALHDRDASVRIAACTAWGHRGGEDAIPVLAEVLSKDAELDVRIAAARALENYRTPDVVPALGIALDDSDPALQHRAIQSLEVVTGKDFGNSVPAWRQYVRNGTVDDSAVPSLAERVRELF
jgi:HEAT repeat protein